MRKLIQQSLLVTLVIGASALSLTGCQPSSRVRDPGQMGAGSAQFTSAAILVPNPDNPWVQLQVAYAEIAAKELGSRIEVIPIRGDNDESIQQAFGAAAAAKATGVLVQPPKATSGIDVRDQAESFGMRMLTVNTRPMDPDTNKFLDLPFFGIENTDLGMVATQFALEEARKRGWTPANTGVILYSQQDGARMQVRAGAIQAGFTEAGWGAPRVIRWTSAAEAQSATTGALSGKTNYILIGPADAPVLAGVRASEAKGLAASNVMGVSIGGLGALDELAKPSSGYFGAVLISPKRHGYDALKKVATAVKSSARLDSLPEFDNGILLTRENLAQVTKDEMLDKLPPNGKTVQP